MLLHSSPMPGPLPGLCRPQLRLLRDGPPEGPLADLVSLYRRNRELLRLLGQARAALREALAYSSRPDANPVLARARVDQIQDRRHRLLAELRANRLTARRFLIP
jgi:hypothetical protein